jgi:DNA-binding GntR family transcriptional regulator
MTTSNEEADDTTTPVVKEKRYRKSSHTAERVAAEIRRAIRHRVLLPGEHVRQEQWADSVGVSSGPTREALKMLVSERLLSYDAHRGYFVARINDREMVQIYQLRRLLETEVLRSIRWPTPEEIKLIRSLMDNTIECVKRGDGHGAMDAAREVCFTIFDLSPLDLVVRETKRYWDMAVVYRALALGTVEDPEAHNLSLYYARLTDCLEQGDRDAFIALNLEERSDIPRRLLAY